MVIEDLLRDTHIPRDAAHPDADALAEADALLEAQLLDVRFDAVRATAGLLLELRMALQFRAGNTGIVIARGVRGLNWSAEPRPTARTAWNITASTPRKGDVLQLDLQIWPQAQLSLSSQNAAFFVGNVPDLDPTPPDYGLDDEATIRANLASWQSDFELVQAGASDAK